MVGRARTHVSNLAHSLKTPLSVLTSEAQARPGPLADNVLRQVETMRRQVDHYLARARAAGALEVLGTRSPVQPVLGDLARVLRRIHAERPVTINVDCPLDLAFRGEKQDLEEMAGNLIDNACKWAKTRVQVAARPRQGGMLLLTVGDDGPGLTEDERKKVGERGERLDEIGARHGAGSGHRPRHRQALWRQPRTGPQRSGRPRSPADAAGDRLICPRARPAPDWYRLAPLPISRRDAQTQGGLS